MPKNLLLCCLPGLDNFIDGLKDKLPLFYNLETLISNDVSKHLERILKNDVIWLEWGNQLASVLTKQVPQAFFGKRVFVRIHSYEVLDSLAYDINFNVVTDIVFVAEHIKQIFLDDLKARGLQLPASLRIHLLPNCIDTSKFKKDSAHERSGLVFLGHINHKKDPMILMHLYLNYIKNGGKEKLYIGGGFQDRRYQFAFEHFLKTNKLDGNVEMLGHITNVPYFLKDKKYTLCTSLMEGHPVGLMEAMSMGVRPLIYNFLGASDIYPNEVVFNNFEDFNDKLQKLEEKPSSFDYVDYIEASYSFSALERYLQKIIG